MSTRIAFESYAEFVDQTGRHGVVAFAKWAKLSDVKMTVSMYNGLSKAAESKRPDLHVLMRSALISEKDQLIHYFNELDKSIKRHKRQQSSEETGSYRGTKSRKIELAKCFFDGPGEKSSDTSGDHLVLNGLDVTRKLMDYRKKLVADHADWAESEDVSKRLALNFIFERSHLESIGIRSDTLSMIFPKRKLKKVSDADRSFLYAIIDCVSQRGSHRDVLNIIWSINLSGGSESTPSRFVVQILTAMTIDEALWLRSSLQVAAVAYQHRYVNPIFKGLLVSLGMEEFIRQDLPTEPNYKEHLQPDYHRTYKEFVVLLGKVTPVQRGKTVVSRKEKAEDRGKLISMMKLSLNRLLAHSVDGPTIVGFLVQDHMCEILTMKMEHEAQYFPTSIGYFNLTLNHMGFGNIATAMPLLLTARSIVEDTIDRINERPLPLPLQEDRVRRMVRDSFYYEPCLVEKTVQHEQSQIPRTVEILQDHKD